MWCQSRQRHRQQHGSGEHPPQETGPYRYRVLGSRGFGPRVVVRVCRWVWMVVRFVCVIRAPVCPVCPVCPPHEHEHKRALYAITRFTDERRNPARARAVWIEESVLLIYGAPRTPIALRRRGKPEPGNVAPHADHGCAHRAGTIHKSHHDIHTCRM